MATIKEKLNKWLGNSEREAILEESVPILEIDLTELQESNVVPPLTTSSSNNSYTSVEQGEVPPLWLADEDSLRDEGVLFGLSESESIEKTDIIHKYFAQIATSYISNIEQKNEEIQELNLFIGQKSDRLSFLNNALQVLSNTRFPHHHFLPRTLLGLSLSIVICIGNFFLIQDTLAVDYPQSSFIALGVFCAGMFNVFGKVSYFHDQQQKANWRTLLEEIGLPVAASIFVFVHSLSFQSFWNATGLFIFMLFLFLFAGKLMLLLTPFSVKLPVIVCVASANITSLIVAVSIPALTLVISKAAVAWVATSKKSAAFKCPVSFALPSASWSSAAKVFMSITKLPPLIASPSIAKVPV